MRAEGVQQLSATLLTFPEILPRLALVSWSPATREPGQRERLFYFFNLLLPALGLRCFMGFPQLQRVGATLSRAAWASHCSGFCYRAQVQLPWGMWHLFGPGITLLSPALTARFLTTGPPGKPKRQVLTEYLATQIVCIVLFALCVCIVCIVWECI